MIGIHLSTKLCTGGHHGWIRGTLKLPLTSEQWQHFLVVKWIVMELLFVCHNIELLKEYKKDGDNDCCGDSHMDVPVGMDIMKLESNSSYLHSLWVEKETLKKLVSHHCILNFYTSVKGVMNLFGICEWYILRNMESL